MSFNNLKTPVEPRLITFDFGDTLVTSDPSYLERTTLGLNELGCDFTRDQVMEAYFKTDVSAAEALLPRAPFSNDEFKEMFSAYFFKHLGLEDRAMELGPPLMKQLMELKTERVLIEGARELLDELTERGYPMGIISNNDGFTRTKCEKVGIDGYFHFILDSTAEGLIKPDPRIFFKAMHSAGVSAEHVLHVGDLWGCDVMGARAANIQAVWLENKYMDPEPLKGAASVSRLLDILSIIAE